MTARTVESLHAVAGAVYPLIPEVDGQHGFVCLEIFTLNGAFRSPVFSFLTQSEFSDAAIAQNFPPEIGDIFRQGTVDIFLCEAASGCFLSAIHNKKPQLRRGLRMNRKPLS